MQVKYAFLHFSYSAPVRVSDTDEATVSAARTTDAAARGFAVLVRPGVDVALRTLVRAPVVRVVPVVEIPVRAVFVLVAPALLAVVARAGTVFAVLRVDVGLPDVARDTVGFMRAGDDVVLRVATLESRTAPSAAPAHNPNNAIKVKTFLILLKMLAKFAKSGQAKYQL